MIKQYQKKPVVINAINWNGYNLEECKSFLGSSFNKHVQERHVGGKNEIHINTLEGVLVASQGDFLVKGIEGEHYSVKPDIFWKLYDEVDDD